MGRVFNRFSHDLQTVDKEVMAGLIRFGDMLLSLVGVLVVTVYAVPPLVIAMVRRMGGWVGGWVCGWAHKVWGYAAVFSGRPSGYRVRCTS